MTAYSSARTGSPFFITIHTGEGILDADDMANFLNNNPEASAHAAADCEKVRPDLVPDNRAAWTAGPTANNWGLHIELCAFAQMTREEWLSEEDVTIFVPWIGARGEERTIRKPRQMLRNAAGWVREKASKFGIHVRKIGAVDLRADRDGICGHADTSAAWGETDHTDPGKNFPWDVFIQMVLGTEQEEDDMYTELDRKLNQSMAARIEGLAKTIGEAQNGPDVGEPLQGPVDINETKWRTHDLMHLKPVGDRDRVSGEEYAFVKAFTEMAATVKKLAADVAELKSRGA